MWQWLKTKVFKPVGKFFKKIYDAIRRCSSPKTAVNITSDRSNLERLPPAIATDEVASRLDKQTIVNITSDRSNLERLPPAIATDEVASCLDKQTIGRLRQTSKTMNKLFQEPSEVAKLLHYVQDANYDEAEKMVKAKPELMFKYVSYKRTYIKDNGTEGFTYETISPLKYAFYALDTYMWKMFQENIKNNRKHMERFTKQLFEQTDRVDLQPLFTEYETYKNESTRWQNNQITDKALDDAWLNVGKKQRETFIKARHLLKEFCRKGDSWDAQSKFDVDVAPRPTSTFIYNYDTKREESVCPFISHFGLGFVFSLIQAPGGVMATRRLLWAAAALAACGRDLATFRRLLEVRTDDLVRLRLQLDSSSQKTNNMDM